MTLSLAFLLIFAPLTVTALMAALFLPMVQQELRFRARLKSLAGQKGSAALRSKGAKTTSERSVRELLREAEKAAGENRRKTLAQRLRHAGSTLTPVRFYASSAGLALFAFVLALAFRQGVAVGVIGAAVAGWVIPQLALAVRISHRAKLLEEQFPDALDTMIRGIRSGLPLADCLRALSVEGTEPLRAEFARLVNDQQVGLSMEEAVKRVAVRLPFSEAQFFSIVVSIQSKSGGNLSQSLSSLSSMLRDRKQLRGKVKALSAEARASAWIIGSMPILVGGIVNVVNPKFMAVLFNTLPGNFVLAGCVIWMVTGIVVMGSMIKIEV